MMRIAGLILFLLGNAAAVRLSLSSRDKMQANPIRKVANLLQEMSSQLDEEGEREQELFDKFMCYCTENTKKLTDGIALSESKISDLESSQESNTAEKERVDQEIAQVTSEVEDNQNAMNTAAAVRKKESAEHDAETADLKSTLSSLNKAIPALENGLPASNLLGVQTNLRKALLVNNRYKGADQLQDRDLQTLDTFFQSQPNTGADGTSTLSLSQIGAPSDAIVGVLKTMRDNMDGALKAATARETGAQQGYTDLVNAKSAEVVAAKKGLEEKTLQSAMAMKAASDAASDLKDTQQSLADDQVYLTDLKTTCAAKEEEWHVRVQMRNEERAAISQAIAVLNEDDNLDVFKKTLPSPEGLLQTAEDPKGTEATKAKVVALINKASVMVRKALPPAAAAKLSSISISVATASGTEGIEKVESLITDLVEALKREQADDDKKRAWCQEEFHTHEMEAEQVQDSLALYTAKIEELEVAIADLQSSIQNNQDAVKNLDTSVTASTWQRKREHSEYVQNIKENEAARAILLRVQAKLAAFYQPKELTESGGAKPGAATSLFQQAFRARRPVTRRVVPVLGFLSTAVTAKRREAPPPPPELWNGYEKKQRGGNSVLELMAGLINDIDTGLAQAKHDEQMAQKEYERNVEDSMKLRADTVKAIADLDAHKTELNTGLLDAQQTKGKTNAELAALMQYDQELHLSCDHVTSEHRYNERKEARDTEIASLSEGLNILHGAK